MPARKSLRLDGHLKIKLRLSIWIAQNIRLALRVGSLLEATLVAGKFFR